MKTAFVILLWVLHISTVYGWTDSDIQGAADEAAYTITTAAQLYEFAEQVNSGKSFKEKTVQLGNDIQLNDTTGWSAWHSQTRGIKRWQPAGTIEYPFEGTFDGQGHTISGLFISAETNGFYVGFFGAIRQAEIRNLTLAYSSVKGYNFVGGLAGYATGQSQIINCHVHALVRAFRNFAGGIAGFAMQETVVDGCSNRGTVIACRNAGGISGYGRDFVVRNSFNRGMVQSEYENAGGIVGMYEEFEHKYPVNIANCYNTGIIKGRDVVGGLIGYLTLYDILVKFKFANCYSAGKLVSRYPVITDGLVGCYTYGNSETTYRIIERINRYSDRCYWSTESCPVKNIDYPRFSKRISSEHWAYFSASQHVSPKVFIKMSGGQMRSASFVKQLNQWVDPEKQKDYCRWESDSRNENDGYPVIKLKTEKLRLQ